ncbi:hypothetical protein KY290_034786 [Solanum tuberosum]|uniref:Superoxide dismutase copper chaperone n=1 Tax=Solanum tuberosum TaxID=4113 RepID=A0ABQ7U5H5_SOLTU|nr:hypothetical protein KY290_034786 [Solanum tuberosum]
MILIASGIRLSALSIVTAKTTAIAAAIPAAAFACSLFLLLRSLNFESDSPTKLREESTKNESSFSSSYGNAFFQSPTSSDTGVVCLIAGVKNVDVDLDNQVVRILGSSPVKTMTEALEQTGRKARLIGQGVPEDFLISAAVAEFKGPDIFGVVRLAQVNMELTRIEANFSGLSPGKHAWSINEFGDLTRGAASTGKLYSPPLGDLVTLEVDEKGEAFYTGPKEKLRVADLMGEL